MGRLRGIEPPSVGATSRCVNHFATTAIFTHSYMRTYYYTSKKQKVKGKLCEIRVFLFKLYKYSNIYKAHE